ncbi:hypothetical protein CEY11_00005 [Candidimonas nitroreducens]|uniref:Cupin n=2 Tax=Candidimonas nitroreducens TaxID=683354 RepID=A0A225MYN3_9BURK|nr:hypothetical protein CEY11_00005 [Candidimonas nitroreducens]
MGTLIDCEAHAPQIRSSDGVCHWVLRCARFLVVLTRTVDETTLVRESDVDEHMAIIPPGMEAVADVEGDRRASSGDALLIMPPGRSELRLRGGGVLTRVFSSRAVDLAARAVNAADYETLEPSLRQVADWPPPLEGYRLRHYALSGYAPHKGISRVFRSTNLMVNIMFPYESPRDPHDLMPHAHEDFEQITVTPAGRFIHHLRTPWDMDSAQWRDDVHMRVGSPSALSIPDRLIHTTQAMEAGCRIIDVFGPPRMDFSLVPGMVLNGHEYPMPEAGAGASGLEDT